MVGESILHLFTQHVVIGANLMVWRLVWSETVNKSTLRDIVIVKDHFMELNY